MKLQILTDVVLADQLVSRPHMVFKKDQILKTENEYVIDTLLQAKYAKILEKIDSKDDIVEETKENKAPKIIKKKSKADTKKEEK